MKTLGNYNLPKMTFEVDQFPWKKWRKLPKNKLTPKVPEHRKRKKTPTFFFREASKTLISKPDKDCTKENTKE